MFFKKINPHQQLLNMNNAQVLFTTRAGRVGTDLNKLVLKAKDCMTETAQN